MNAECYPVSLLPHLTKLFVDFLSRQEPFEPFYPATAYSAAWMETNRGFSAGRRVTLCELLSAQNLAEAIPAPGANPAASPPDVSQVRKNLAALAEGAGVVVTGQQATLLGGPLYTLLKAATAVRRARDATAAGHPHVPVFWIASEDHDLAEANQVSLPYGEGVETLRIRGEYPASAPVGGLKLGPGIAQLLSEAKNLLDPSQPAAAALWADITACYRPDATFAEAFGGLLRRIFAPYGLIIIDAASRPFHALGAKTLREAVLNADDLRQTLQNRGRELEAAGYHAQVMVAAESSLLFLVDRESGARLPLHRPAGAAADAWQAGRQSYSTADLLAILDEEPERLSPNALLRPVFQDSILPTSTYIGGPSEIAYFAQSQVLYESILHRCTPVQPRLSATLIEPAIAGLLQQHSLHLPDVLEASAGDPLELAQRLGAGAIPAETREKIDAADKALDRELEILTSYLGSLGPDMARTAAVGASKMRYQMNRLRRLAANEQLRRDGTLAADATALKASLFPNRHPQERVFGLAWFLARHGASLVDAAIAAAAPSPGHRALFI